MITQELIQFIQQGISQGKSREELKQILLSNGDWQESDVDEAFSSINNPVPQKPKERSKRKLVIILLVIFTLIVGYFLMTSRPSDGYKDLANRASEARKTPDETCQSSKQHKLDMNPYLKIDPNYDIGCEAFLDLWYEYHSKRLGITESELDQITSIESFDLNTTAMPGATIYRVGYFVNYGEDISVVTHDSFPLSITSDLYPSVTVPRDGSPLTHENLLELSKTRGSLGSKLTQFPVGSLAYNKISEIKNSLKNLYENGEVDILNYSLGFNREDIPVASLYGSNRAGTVCLTGEHNLLTNMGSIGYPGPCSIE